MKKLIISVILAALTMSAAHANSYEPPILFISLTGGERVIKVEAASTHVPPGTYTAHAELLTPTGATVNRSWNIRVHAPVTVNAQNLWDGRSPIVGERP